LVERLVASHLPVVTVAEEVPGVPFVGIDEQQGGRLLAEHLAAKGYKRVLYRSIEDEFLPPTQQERMNAFCEVAKNLGLEVQHSRRSPKDHLPSPQEKKLLLSKTERPDVIACWGDVSADGLVAWCQDHGLRIPQDIAITGFDGFPSTFRPSMALTTIRAPWSDVARTAVGVLAARCDGREAPERTLLPVEFVGGATT
jgi:DNA-binding LacI/PurR family transcriptional regulator